MLLWAICVFRFFFLVFFVFFNLSSYAVAVSPLVTLFLELFQRVLILTNLTTEVFVLTLSGGVSWINSTDTWLCSSCRTLQDVYTE